MASQRASIDAGVRTLLMVPLRRDDVLLGYITAHRREVRPFSEKEIALLQNFAAQAVIGVENARLLTETRQALEQQTATAEVLGVINSSPGELTPVFDAMLEKATRLCEAPFGILRTWDGERFHFGAVRGAPQFSDWVRQRGPIRPERDDSLLGRIIAGEQVVSFADALGDQSYRDPGFRQMAKASGIRSAVTVALHKDDALLGTITVYRTEVRPFSDKQVALLQNFAAQAVIAMENARLINETREALEQQTATAEVLQVINSSPGDLTPVFETMLERAIRLCEATHGHLFTFDGECFCPAAVSGFVEWAQQVGAVRPTPSGPLARIGCGERIVHIADVREEDVYRTVASFREQADIRGVRSQITVGLFKDNALLGAMVIYRQEVRPFSDKQIALLQNFAAQAVIAMENARLLTETREALQQQTATAEVLQVINSSPGDLAPVFDAILEKAHSLCGAAHGSLHIAEGESFRGVAMRGVPEAFADIITQPFQPGPNHPVRKLIGGTPFAIVINSPEFDDPIIQSAYKLAAMRTGLFVPLRKDRVLLGYIVAARPEIQPFTDKQIALLQNFAAQAVIAMENARLLTETREALEQQTATAEVLQVINSSPGDLAPVFDTILEKAHSLCGATHGGLNIYDSERFRNVAGHALPPRFAELMRQPFQARPIQQRLLRGERYVHVPDMMTRTREDPDDPIGRASDEAGIRTLLVVPLRKDEALLGYITAHREEVRPFTDKQIALLQNFAAQAVIAMENARLLTETREALEQQTATAEVLQVINSSPGDLKPVFDAMLEKATRLCEAPFGILRIWDGERFQFGAVHGEPRRRLDNGRAADRHAARHHDLPADRGSAAAGRSRTGRPHGGTCGDGHVGWRRGVDLGAHHFAKRLHSDQPLLRDGLGERMDRHRARAADRGCPCRLGAQGVLASLLSLRRSGVVENRRSPDRPGRRGHLVRLLGRERAPRRRAVEWRDQLRRCYRVPVRRSHRVADPGYISTILWLEDRGVTPSGLLCRDGGRGLHCRVDLRDCRAGTATPNDANRRASHHMELHDVAQHHVPRLCCAPGVALPEKPVARKCCG
jgi:GAF domain-containing protein